MKLRIHFMSSNRLSQSNVRIGLLVVLPFQIRCTKAFRESCESIPSSVFLGEIRSKVIENNFEGVFGDELTV